MPEVLLKLRNADRLKALAPVDRLGARVRPDYEPAVVKALIDDVVAVQIASQCDVRSHDHSVACQARTLDPCDPCVRF